MTAEQAITGVKKQMLDQQKANHNDRAKWLAWIVRVLEGKKKDAR